MKRSFISILALLLMASCQMIEQVPEHMPADDDLYASIESLDATKTVMDENNNVLWSEEDQLVAFMKTTLGVKYQIKEQYVGTSTGGFSKIEEQGNEDDFESGQEIDHNVVLYPHSTSVWCMKNDSNTPAQSYKLNVVLPETQVYEENSFGIGSFPMIAVSTDNKLTFRNICGGVKLQFKGVDKIKSIKLEGLGGEKISGKSAVVGYVNDSAPTITMASGDKSYSHVILDCGEGVQLSETAPTTFIIAVPPVEFASGMKITVTDTDGLSRTLTNSSVNTVKRSSMIRFPVITYKQEGVFEIPEGTLTSYEIPAEGGTVEIPVTTNLEYEVVIPEEAKDWISYVASKVIRNEVISINIDENVLPSERSAEVLICSDNDEIVQSITITQLRDIPYIELESVPDYQIWYSATQKVQLNESADYGAALLSHDWDKSTGKGVVTFDGPVTSIGESAFYNHSALTSVSIPESVKSIGDKAFSKCIKLKEINIPAGVSEMGKYVFEECNSLPVTNNIIYADTYLVKISDKSLNSATGNMIKEGTRWIGENAFYNYDNMTSIVIPEGVVKIGESAFSNCDNLNRVTIPSSLTSIGESAFYECRKITAVNITDLTAWCNIDFAYYASPFSSYTTSRLVLNGNVVTSLLIPDGITSIGDYTFSSCSSLTSVTIPESVTSIGYATFYSCENLERVTIHGGLTNMGRNVFALCENLKSVTLHDGVTMIGESAFQQCEALTDVMIPGSVVSIEDSAFSYCKSLTSVTIPEGLKSIGRTAFSHCTGISGLTLSSTVESIGDFAFYDCNSLKEVICRPVDPPVLGTSAFDSNASNRKIYVPSKAVDSYKTDGSWGGYANYIFSMSGDDVECLSQGGTANCYIVSRLGSYEFTPTKGNSSESVGEIATAEVLWESFGTDVTPNVGDLVKNVKYADGVISFDTPSVFKEGNAVIAAKDASGNILWSWHIWLTDEPEGQVYYNNAGTMMDRNLGATSATPGDVGALGLLYQWGRKDPFLSSSSISSSTEAKSTIIWPSPLSSDSSSGTIEYATANPTTLITNGSNTDSSNADWYYTGSSSTDNTRWTTSSSSKSIYDPCPAGWRVPDGGKNGVWSKATGFSSYYTGICTYDGINKGMNFSGKLGADAAIWYPASGVRSCASGLLFEVGSYGYYWSASPTSHGSKEVYNLFLTNSSGLNPSDYDFRSFAYSVRCVKE